MSDNIIEYYKQANDARLPGAPQPVNEIAEVLTEEVAPIIENKSTVIPEDPFAKFLVTLNENLQKKQAELQLLAKKNDNQLVEQAIPESNTDPFAGFIDKLQTIVKDKKEQSIKDAAIGFINELKEKTEDNNTPDNKEQTPIESNEEQKIEIEPEIEHVIEPKPVDEQEKRPRSVVIQKQKTPEQPYIKELEASTQQQKLAKKPTKSNDIKTLVTQQVEAQTSKILEEVKAYAKRILDLGGGGGSVAQQFANGGIMNGDLNVTGQYLSGGVTLTSIFSGGGGSRDRLISGSSSLILNSDGSLQFPNNVIRSADDTEIILESENAGLGAYTQVALTPHGFIAYDNEGDSISFDSVSNTISFKTVDNYTWILDDQGNIAGPSGLFAISGNLNTTGKILSGGRDLSSIFLTQETDSQTLTYKASSYELSISNGNTVSLASLSSKPTDLSFLSVSGNWNSTYTTVTSNSGFWNTAYNTSTAYQSTSGSFITAVSGTNNQINTSKSGSTITLSLPNSAVFPGDVSVVGNLTVSGSATYINVQNLIVGDNLIYLNNNNHDSNLLDTGFVSNFNQAPLGYNHTGLVRRAGQGVPGVWTLFSGLTTEPASAANIDWDDKNIKIDSLSANLIGNVIIGTPGSDAYTINYDNSNSYSFKINYNDNNSSPIFSSTNVGEVIFAGTGAFFGFADRADSTNRTLDGGFYKLNGVINFWNNTLSQNTISIADNGSVHVGVNSYNTYSSDGSTSNMPYKFEVAGGDSHFTNQLLVDGNVGIGTSAPGFKLEVNDATVGAGWVTRFQRAINPGDWVGILFGGGPYHEGFIQYYDDGTDSKFGFGIGGDSAAGVAVLKGGRLSITDASSIPVDDGSGARIQTTTDGNSIQWNNAYTVATTYQNTSGSFATNTLLRSTSALLTPLTLTNTLTSQLATNQLNYLPLSGGTMTGNLVVNASFAAQTKSFLINHPSLPNKKLQYGSLESPYHGIRLTGRSVIKDKQAIIELPHYIKDLVQEDNINIQLTNIKHSKILFVKDIDISNNSFTVGINCKRFNASGYEFFWSFTAVRKDIPDLEVEI